MKKRSSRERQRMGRISNGTNFEEQESCASWAPKVKVRSLVLFWSPEEHFYQCSLCVTMWKVVAELRIPPQSVLLCWSKLNVPKEASSSSSSKISALIFLFCFVVANSEWVGLKRVDKGFWLSIGFNCFWTVAEEVNNCLRNFLGVNCGLHCTPFVFDRALALQLR